METEQIVAPAETPQETPQQTPESQQEIQQPEQVTTPEPIKQFEFQQSVPAEDYYTPEKVIENFKGKEQVLFNAAAKAAGLSEYALSALPYIRDERTMAAFGEAMRTDWTQVPDEQLLAMKLKEEYSQVKTLSAERIQRLVESTLRTTYGFGEQDDPESEEVLRGQINAYREAKSFREQKLAERENILQSLAKAPSQESVPQVSPVQMMEADRNRLLSDEKVQQIMKSKTISYGDYNHELSDPNQTLATIYDQNKYLYHIAQKDAEGKVMMQVVTNERGQQVQVPIPDNAKLLKMAAYAENMEGIEKGIFQNGVAYGKKQLVDEAEVIPNNNQSFGTEKPTESLWAAMAKAPIRS